MNIITKFKLFEDKINSEKFEPSKQVQKEILRFSDKWGIELDPHFTLLEIKVISQGLDYYDTKFIKDRIDRIIREDLGAVHGRWKDTKTKKWMYLNPSIFDFKRRWKNDQVDIPYALFTIVHEIAHCVDYIERVSFSKEWQSISGWKKCDRDEKVPEGWTRYVEKRPGRGKPGKKRSNWIHKTDADFCRKYTSKNPREDFADSLSFVILGFSDKLKGQGGLKKLQIINKLLKKVE